MKFELIRPVNENYDALHQILTNRAIPYNKVEEYMNSTDENINSWTAFGGDICATMKNAAAALMTTIVANGKCLIIIDSDCDGYTSGALLINYLYNHCPAWVQNHLTWFIHQGKQHGLSDFPFDDMDKYDLVICPDSSSNDYEYHQKLREKNIQVIVLDHHEAEKVSEFAFVINNQLSDYPNKDFSGVGITWQFCRYLDSLIDTHYAEDYLDLVALGNCADMMSMTSIETKHIINKGFKRENIKNPFIYYMAEKNAFKLGDEITFMGAAFYIAPFVNAMVRSGTMEEKELLFESMLKFKAFEIIPSTKRGCKGETEKLVEQAVRTCTNVKNRQTRAQDDGMALLENMIIEENLLDHKVLLFLLEPGQIDRNIAGLIANKFMAKYQRPCCILTKVTERIGGEMILPQVGLLPDEVEYTPVKTKVSYQGSARGYDKSGITNFKDICAAAPSTLYAEGHQGAFGLGIECGYLEEENGAEVYGEGILQFIEYTDEVLKDMNSEPVYYVDYVYNENTVNPQHILDIAHLDYLWGKDMDEPLVAIEKLQVTKNMVNIYRKSTNTVKITLPSGVNLLMFCIDEELCKKLENNACVTFNMVGICKENEWNGWVTPQIEIKDFEILTTNKYLF